MLLYSDVLSTHYLFFQIDTLLLSELEPIIHYPRPKELTDDEQEELSPSLVKNIEYLWRWKRRAHLMK
jgi:hypothetical protein